jgi:hypothetical protein
MTGIVVLPSLDYYHENIPIGAATNWQAVAYPSAGAYIRGAIDGTYTTDIFEPVHPITLGTGYSVRQSVVAKAIAAGHHVRPTVFDTWAHWNAGLGRGDVVTVPGDSTWRWYVYDWGATNPFTGAAWTAADIASLYFGVMIDHTTVQATEVVLAVDYTPTPSGTMAMTGDYTDWFQWLLFGQTLNVAGHHTRASGHNKALVYGEDATIVGAGSLDGGSSTTIQVVNVSGTCTITGISATQKLTIENTLGNGIVLHDPKDCLVKWVKTDNCNDHAVAELSRLGVGVLFWGHGYGGATTGNRITECEILRSGQHGIQFCDVDGGEADHNLIDGVDANFGISAFGYERTPSGVNIHHNTIRNTRAEWVNIMNFAGVIKDEDNICENTRADFGHCGYLCPAPTSASIARNICKNSNKEAIALNTCSGWLVDANECYGMGAGGDHHAAILLESSADGNCENNIVQNNILVDEYGRIYFAVKEVDGGLHCCLTNQVLNNDITGFRAIPVHLSPTSMSVQSGNGMD